MHAHTHQYLFDVSKHKNVEIFIVLLKLNHTTEFKIFIATPIPFRVTSFNSDLISKTGFLENIIYWASRETIYQTYQYYLYSNMSS